MVPVPPSEPRSSDDGLMVHRRWSEEREYLSQRTDSKLDFNGPRVLECAIGLKASEWRTIWFNDESSRAPYEAKFLKPRVPKDKDYSEGNGNGKQKKKTKSKKGADDDRKIKFEFKFEDEKDIDHKDQP
ncbi:hypothetical protein FRC11_003895 [Ceratobasidium sp. 423]|nr:hypothetical protein FRC11_003895 [Ceratobasidium sp. 423]